MSIADRIFYAAIGIQVLAWLLSAFLAADNWIVIGLFWIWIAFVPAIGFYVGRSGGKVPKACGLSTLLFVAWFSAGAVDMTFSSIVSASLPPDLWLKGLAGYALSCFFLAVVALLVVTLAALIGRHLNVRSLV